MKIPKKGGSCVVTVLLAVAFTAPAGGDDSAGPEPTGLGERVPGSWELDDRLTRRLAGQTLHSDLLTLEVSDEAPLPDLPAELGGAEVSTHGTLTNGSHTGRFAVVRQDGVKFLQVVFLDDRGESAVSLTPRLWFVEAVDPADDLLILSNHPAPQVMVYRRVAESAFSELTRSLLDAALHSETFGDAEDARGFLSQRPDWQAAAARVVESIREDPRADHNNRCLLLSHLAREHAGELELDAAPLLAAAASPSWTNQQKCLGVLVPLAKAGRLDETTRRELAPLLIRRTTSQRGRVIEPTLELLRLLTGQELGRDPEGWRAWYAEEHGEFVDLDGAVSETLVLVRPIEGEDGTTRYRVQDRSFDELDDVVRRVQAIEEQSVLPVNIVVLLENPRFERPSIPQAAQGLAEVLLPLDFSVTVSPATDVFYPPFRPTGPG